MNFQISNINEGSQKGDNSTNQEAQTKDKFQFYDSFLNLTWESNQQDSGWLNPSLQFHDHEENLQEHQFQTYQEFQDNQVIRMLTIRKLTIRKRTNRGNTIIEFPEDKRKEFVCGFCDQIFHKHQSLGGHIQKKQKGQDEKHKKK